MSFSINEIKEPKLLTQLPMLSQKHVLSLFLSIFCSSMIYAQTVYTSVQSGNWSNPNTWGLVSGEPSGGDGKIEGGDIVNIMHEIDYNLTNALDIEDGEVNVRHVFTVVTQQNIIVQSNGILTCSGGEIILPLFNGGANLNGNLSVSGGICFFENSTIEIAQNWEGTGGAQRTVINSCMLVGENVINDGTTDIYTDFCLEYGFHGSGNFENQSTSGTIDCTLCTFLDSGSGNFSNAGEVFSSNMDGTPPIVILRVTGNLINDGIWDAQISNYCVGGNITGSVTGLPDLEDDLPGFEFCALTMGVTCSCPAFEEPTPVRFLYFRGSSDNRKSRLEWATTTEINNKGFEIQRSVNGQSYISIGFVDGAGNSSNEITYEFTDMEPFVGDNIYRLKQIDFNGDFEFSHIVPIQIESQMSLEMIPNPSYSHDLSALFFNDYEGEIDLFIYNLNGQLVFQKNYMGKTGGKHIDLSDLRLSHGIYFIKARAGFQSISAKFIVIE